MTTSLPSLALLAALAAGPACGADDAPPPEPLFTLAVIADPHITGNAEREERLQTVVDAINAAIVDRDIQLVAVLGDIGWNGGLPTAKGLLDQLQVPYIPLIGDNEYHGGAEQTFDTTFAPIYDDLATALAGWHKAATPVDNPETGVQSWFQNFGFDYQGVHFLAVDWCARTDGTGEYGGDVGYLHDFEGGTLPWFENQLLALADAEPDSVIMLTHIPMHEGAFEVDTAAVVADATAPYATQLWADLAGHVHLTYGVDGESFEVWATAATWSSYEPVRLVTVSPAGDPGDGFVYEQDLLYVPY